ncbi:RIC1 [Candida margitis]|uniref:RIC1 n=1 Tax=Candida margitis TaxID=1775924 RepID=UPI002227E87D|nr:RIC1 [Candida margitis]KAI5949641.1 RIC1 [Candida margitis]
MSKASTHSWSQSSTLPEYAVNLTREINSKRQTKSSTQQIRKHWSTLEMINGCPNFAIDFNFEDEIIDIIQFHQIVALVTKTSVYIYHSYTLLPLTSHTRSSTSIETNGVNLRAKKKLIYNASRGRQSKLNLFIQTDLNYLVIYQISVDYSHAIYEVHNNNHELIQAGVPMNYSSGNFSFTKFLQSATKSFMQGNDEDVSPKLENVESINNNSIDDELGGYDIEPVKLSVYKVLQMGSGVGRQEFWLQSNSHALFIFNFAHESNEEVESDYFQVVDLSNFETRLVDLSTFSWFKNPAKRIFYNQYGDYFLLITEASEIIYIKFDNEVHAFTVGSGDLNGVSFSPTSNLLIGEEAERWKLFSLKDNILEKLKTLGVPQGRINWSSCGGFFTLIEDSGNWKLLSRFGKVLFDTHQTINELNGKHDHAGGFLNASTILIGENSNTLYVMSQDSCKLYLVPLYGIVNDVVYDQNYITVIENHRNFVRFPMLPKFKRLLLHHDNISSIDNAPSQQGEIIISKNYLGQLSISYGDNLAVSTPIKTGGQTNHILWFNCKIHFAEPLNIIDQFWFQDYLVVVNRRTHHDFETAEGDKEQFVDEVIVFDTSQTKYGMSGENITFSTDSLLWRYDFKCSFVATQLIHDKDMSHIVILTADSRLVVLDLVTDKTVNLDSQAKHYRIFISTNKTVHLASLKHKLNLHETRQISMIDKRHFLFLLQSGELYLLKNVTRSPSFSKTPVDVIKPSNMYDLIKLNSSIEFFKFVIVPFQSPVQFVYLFNGDQVLIYDVNEVVEKACNKLHEGQEDVFESDDESALVPIAIDADDILPLEIETDQKSINLIGLENLAQSYHHNGFIVKNKLAHKLILNNFIEFDLVHRGDLESTFNKYKSFANFQFCLELLLFKLLVEEQQSTLTLKRLFQLIEFTESPESVYINCLRKIEVAYWGKFFNTLNTTPVKFMDRLIKLDNVELCYNYLIVYLNYKKEGESGDNDDSAETTFHTNGNSDQLSQDDKQIIVQIIRMLAESEKWDWCFELCRFIKILEPSGQFLQEIKVNFG